VRGVPDFEYCARQGRVGPPLPALALRNPERVMTIVRPCIVLGPNVDNYIVRLWTQPFQLDFGAGETPCSSSRGRLVDGLLLLIEAATAAPSTSRGDGTMRSASWAT